MAVSGLSDADHGVLLAVSVTKDWGLDANRVVVLTVTEKFDEEFFIDRMKNRLEKIEAIAEPQTALKRVTDFSLHDLKARLSGDPFMERCLVANEIGIISLTDPENQDEAEEILRGLLRDDDPSVRYAVYCFLLAKQYLALDTYKEISRFQDQPENESMLQGAAEAVREIKIQLNSPPE